MSVYIRRASDLFLDRWTYHIIHIHGLTSLETEVCHSTTKTRVASASPCLLTAVDSTTVDCETNEYVLK